MLFYAINNGIVFVFLIFFVIVFLLDESDVPSSIVSKVSGGVSSVSCLKGQKSLGMHSGGVFNIGYLQSWPCGGTAKKNEHK